MDNRNQRMKLRYIDLKGQRKIKEAVDMWIRKSLFFCVEPLPDDNWRLYFKEGDTTHIISGE